jgi:mitochondrial fission protein ELM1
MTKDQAIQASEKLLMHIYDGEFEVVARICTASVDKDAEYLYYTLDEVAKFIEELKAGLKK